MQTPTAATHPAPSLNIAFYIDSVPFTKGVIAGTTSLGGSESACLALARGLSRRGHDVHVFATKMADDAAGQDTDQVQYHPASQLPQIVKFSAPDVMVSLRMPGMFNHRLGSKLNILWAQDLMTPGYEGAVDSVLFQVDQIHYVSQYHQAQWEGRSKLVGTVPAYITANPFDVGAAIRASGQSTRGRYRLAHISRPERGLDAVLRYWPAIRQKYPEATLTVCRYSSMYDTGGWGQVCRGYDEKVAMVNQMVGGIEYAGELGKLDLYKLLGSVNGLFYPTSQPGFAETNCIAVAEAQACGCPVIASDLGAIPETLQPGAGILVAGNYMDPATKAGFMDAVDQVFGNNGWSHLARTMGKAGQTQAAQAVDQDVVAARWEQQVLGTFKARAQANQVGLLRQFLHNDNHVHGLKLAQAIVDNGADVTSPTPTPEFVEAVDAVQLCKRVIAQEDLTADQYAQYAIQDPRHEMGTNGRLIRAAQEISDSLVDLTEAHELGAGGDATMPRYWNVLDVAGGNGTFALILLSQRPDVRVTLIDFSQGVLDMAKQAADELGLADRLDIQKISPWDYAAKGGHHFDAIMCGEFLEHVEKPWEVLGLLESMAAPDALICLTTPCGPFYELLEPTIPRHRGHIHSFTLRDLTTMLTGRTASCEYMEIGQTCWGSPVGTWLIRVQAQPVNARHPFLPIDYGHLMLVERPYQRVVAGMIVKDAVATLHKTLASIYRIVDQVVVIDTGSTDGTLDLLDQWATLPHGKLSIHKAPFPDDFSVARNSTLVKAKDLGADWFLWVDADEELINGEAIRHVAVAQSPFLAYAMKQQHTMVDQPTFSDKPNRLFRVTAGYPLLQFYGVVHEQPGMAGKDDLGHEGWDRPIAPALDLASPQSPLFWHSGYSTEKVRVNKMFGRNRPLLKKELSGRGTHPARMLAWAFEIRDQLNLARYASSQQEARQHLHAGIAIFEAKFTDITTPAYTPAREWYEQCLDLAKMGWTVLYGVTIAAGPKADPPKAKRLRTRDLDQAAPLLTKWLDGEVTKARGELPDTRAYHSMQEGSQSESATGAPMADDGDIVDVVAAAPAMVD